MAARLRCSSDHSTDCPLTQSRMDVMPDTAGYVHGKRTDQIQIHRGNEDLPGHERLSIDRPHADPGVRLYRVRMISLIPSISKSPRSRSDLTESHVRVAGGGITCHPFIELSLDQNENRSKSPQKSNNHSDVTDAEQTPRLTSVVADNIGLTSWLHKEFRFCYGQQSFRKQR